MGVPYIPVIGLAGTDLLKRRDDMLLAPDPFDGKTISVVAKAMRPDVAVFHVDRADRQGNVSCGYPVEAVILAEASRHVIVTAEEVVDRLEEKGLVVRDRDARDRRVVRVRLTEKGAKLHRSTIPFFEKSIAEFFSPLTKVQQKELASLLRKLIRVSWSEKAA